MGIRIHPTAEVSDGAMIGEESSVWHHAQVREGALIGVNCIIGKGVYIDAGVTIGDNVKIQNYVSVYHGVTLEDGVFVGPHVCFTNDLRPRAINPDGSLKAADDWVLSETLIRRGAALGANSTIRCGITVGEWAMIGAGSVVTRDVPAYGLVWGNPTRLQGFVCPCGEKLEADDELTHHRMGSTGTVIAVCPKCGRRIEIDRRDWEMSNDQHR
jgi:UDP-2-acetamido-3-amino-2,3-dideoxy-glucuronate N-acetyltransferase